MTERPPSAWKAPLKALVRTINDGRFLNVVFLAMLVLSLGTVGVDLQQMIASAPDGIPGSQRLEPAPMELPKPGDQTRIYLPKTMPLGPNRGRPTLPGYSGPVEGAVLSEPMKFFAGLDGAYSAIGTITPGTAKRFAAFTKSHEKQIGVLHLHSPGGSVSDALSMARQIRRAGISTQVPANGYCASSCPLVLSGGLYRSAGERSWVGVHQIYSADGVGTLERGMADAQFVSALCQKLLVDMEVDPKVWIFAMQTPSASLYVFTPAQLKTLKLANARKKTILPKSRPIAEG